MNAGVTVNTLGTLAVPEYEEVVFMSGKVPKLLKGDVRLRGGFEI